MYIIKIDNTTFSLHPNNKTTFMVFKNYKHAHKINNTIKYFISKNHTLPPTYSYDGMINPLPLTHHDHWTYVLYSINVEEINKNELVSMCKKCNADYFYITDVIGDLNKISYLGDIYESPPPDINDTIKYLETLM